MVGRRSRVVLGLDRRVLRRSVRAARGDRVLGSRDDARRRVVPGLARQLRRAHLRRQAIDAALAIRIRSELRELDSWSWAELRAQTAAIAAGLRRWASGPAIASPRTCRTSPRRSPRSSRVSSIGAIWSSAAPEFGARSVIDRFAQIEPKVLLAIDGYGYGGKRLRPPCRRRPRSRRRCPRSTAGRDLRLPRRQRLGAGLPRASRAAARSSSCRSSTRSGCSTAPARPACRSRSSTARAASCSSSSRRANLHLDAQTGDRLFWFSTTGWMMWNFLVGVLLTDASIVLYRRQSRATRTSARCGISPSRRA